MNQHLNQEEVDQFYNKIKTFDNLNHLLSKKKLKGEKRKFYRGDEFSIFSIVLSSQEYWQNFLQNLDLIMVNNLYSDKRKRDKIFDNVFNFLTELEFGRICLDADIIPDVDVVYYKNKDIDYKLPSNLYIEVTTPKLNKSDNETWMKKACAVPISLGVEETLLRKIQKQDMNYAIKDGFSDPILILINGNFRGIDKITIQSESVRQILSILMK